MCPAQIAWKGTAHLVLHAQLPAVDAPLHFEHHAASRRARGNGGQGSAVPPAINTVTVRVEQNLAQARATEQIQQSAAEHPISSWSWLCRCHSRPRRRASRRRDARAAGCPASSPPSTAVSTTAGGASTVLSQPLKAASCLSSQLREGARECWQVAARQGGATAALQGIIKRHTWCGAGSPQA